MASALSTLRRQRARIVRWEQGSLPTMRSALISPRARSNPSPSRTLTYRLFCVVRRNVAPGSPLMLGNRGLGGSMLDLREQFSDNNNQVRDAERRLAIQHTFIARLRASERDTKSAEETLEVIRDILRGLYNQRSQLRRRIGGQKRSLATPGGAQNGRHRGQPRR